MNLTEDALASIFEQGIPLQEALKENGYTIGQSPSEPGLLLISRPYEEALAPTPEELQWELSAYDERFAYAFYSLGAKKNPGYLQYKKAAKDPSRFFDHAQAVAEATNPDHRETQCSTRLVKDGALLRSIINLPKACFIHQPLARFEEHLSLYELVESVQSPRWSISLPLVNGKSNSFEAVIAQNQLVAWVA